MKGRNVISACPAVVVEAVQHYFATVLFRPGACPLVTNVVMVTNVSPEGDLTNAFRIEVEGGPQPGGPDPRATTGDDSRWGTVTGIVAGFGHGCRYVVEFDDGPKVNARNIGRVNPCTGTRVGVNMADRNDPVFAHNG